MITNVSVHRRANAFAQALEEQVLRGAAAEDQVDSPAQAPVDARLLAVADGLGELPKPEMAAEVKTVQRAQLIAAMEAAFAEGAPSGDARVPDQREAKGAHRATKSLGRLRPRSRLSKGLAAGGLTVGVAAGAFSGVAAASTDALPGDSLYGLKRGMEDLQLTMADDDSDRGRLYLDQASTRMLEARRLMERGRSAHLDHEALGEVRRALAGVRHDAGEGHRLLHAAYKRDGSLGPIQALNSFTRSHRDTWTQLRDRLPVQLTDVRDEVSSVFDAIDDEVGPLRSLLPQGPDAARNRHRETPADGSTTGSGHRPSPAGDDSASDAHGTAEQAPRPSASPSQQQDGLLGGSTGGLLGTPGKGSASPHDGSHGKEGTGHPDVTLPPLLPGLLPDLGIDGDNLSK
ncbi:MULTISPECIES: DUF5667 domain-containing protein [unclassified Streptomyces]|uniref:DUF5667 domain-containing protein n=1 Tax=unclassified Streptomyces TaxID=2593676 RepID=UPI000C26FEB3|nr:DUF5667 domain-containing protein [Streptomyces sp. CB02959]PJN37787.1 hypothetical protein CG747_27315 [Streptomyces sp. CB02959]